MKKEKLTPEQIGSKLGDPDFLDNDGYLLGTPRKGRTKTFGEVTLIYNIHKSRQKSLYISFLKSREVVGCASYLIDYAGNFVSFFTVREIYALYESEKDPTTLMQKSRGQFIDHMIHKYPSTAAWILWNI
jgi:hypothetical protein